LAFSNSNINSIFATLIPTFFTAIVSAYFLTDFKTNMAADFQAIDCTVAISINPTPFSSIVKANVSAHKYSIWNSD